MALPFFVFMIFLTPLVIDPMFNKFEPLTNHEPQLVSDLERVVNRVGLQIPPERMFWMNASAKAKFVNAYVTGLGASKRVVVWDTTIAKMTRAEIAFIFGHEMGHYVLNHVYDGLIASCAGLFVVLFITAWVTRRCIERRGERVENSRAIGFGRAADICDPHHGAFVSRHADYQRLLALPRASSRSIWIGSDARDHPGLGASGGGFVSDARRD